MLKNSNLFYVQPSKFLGILYCNFRKLVLDRTKPNFRIFCEFQDEWQLSPDQVAEFKEVFMLFDKDEDGVITFPEVIMVMKSLGQRPSDEDLLEMVRDVSEDKMYDTIEFNEFLQMMSKQQRKGLSQDTLKDAFR